METRDILKLFTSKLIDLLFHIHGSSLKNTTSTDSKFQLITNTYSLVHSELNYIWESERKVSTDFSIEIILESEDCASMLLERWNFHLETLSVPLHCTSLISLSSTLRILSSAASLFPSRSFPSKSIYIKDHHLNSYWPTQLLPTELIYFPSAPIKIVSESESLSIYIEYYNKSIKPSICLQVLGTRPRLKSAGNFDSGISTGRNLGYMEIKRKSSNNESIYEENEVGIKLISSEIMEDSGGINEDFGRSSFDMEIDIGGNLDTPEEAKISIYMLSCEKIRELVLFKHLGEADSKVLLESWREKV